MNTNINYMDDEVKDIFTNKENKQSIYRYIPLSNIHENKLWFSNPNKWKDPFERLFIESTYKMDGKIIPYKYKNHIYCMCITTTKHNEAAWKVYNSEVQFRISKENFLSILEKYTEKYDIYIGKVEYRNTSEIKKLSPFTLLNLKQIDFRGTKGWIKLLLQKRKDFSYENEIRILLVEKNINDKKEIDGINLEYDYEFTELFPKAIISPCLDDNKKKETIEILTKKFFYSEEQIWYNTLYKEVKPRNINLDYKKGK